jgi:2-polyprenyl-3-methyl-5-hydroxy-6-metoxy-1,4-benzoquinol methylase
MTECASCGAWFVWPLPSRTTIGDHYRAADAGMPRQLREWRAGTSQRTWYDVLARRIASLKPNPRTVADIGAGALELTRSLAEQFPTARLEAWDLFADGVKGRADLPPRVSLHPIDLNVPSSPTGRSFDAVACVAVVEHVLDPLALLRLLHSIAAPGGLIYVAAPNVDSLAHRLLGRAWPYYAPDDHLTLPSLRSIAAAIALSGQGRYRLRRMNVHYSLRYLARFLRLPLPVPASLDVLLPIPSGAFELVWEKAP